MSCESFHSHLSAQDLMHGGLSCEAITSQASGEAFSIISSHHIHSPLQAYEREREMVLFGFVCLF